MNRTRLIAISLCFLIVTGCATKPILSKNATTLDLSNESVALIYAKFSNNFVPGYQPDIKKVYIQDLNKRHYTFAVEEKYKEVEDSYNEYLISFHLPPGKYVLNYILARSGVFPVIGTFWAPFVTEFTLNPNEVVYLGYIEAVVEERVDFSNLRAGPILPLIDQSVVGASTGTFRIKIEDQYDDNIQAFKSEYPQLGKIEIRNGILPPWNEPESIMY